MCSTSWCRLDPAASIGLLPRPAFDTPAPSTLLGQLSTPNRDQLHNFWDPEQNGNTGPLVENHGEFQDGDKRALKQALPFSGPRGSQAQDAIQGALGRLPLAP